LISIEGRGNARPLLSWDHPLSILCLCSCLVSVCFWFFISSAVPCSHLLCIWFTMSIRTYPLGFIVCLSFSLSPHLAECCFSPVCLFFPAYLCNKSCLFTKVSWTVPLFSRRSSLCFFWQACSLLSSPASVLFLHFSILCCTTTNLIEYYLACLTMSSEGKTVHFIKEKGRITVKNKCAYKLTCITSVLNRQGYQYQKVKKGEQE